ncbi:MAG TPA: protein kinase, partial [Candidatus Acidoferrales bacterium]|nr:protein kinase [Candidatus Acidoferrales bacterium]
MLKKIGKFEILGELGRGAMGIVYRGKDPFIGRTVAIKTITGNFTDNPDLLERFYREARAAGGLQHPNIVTIYDMGEDSGTPYIAMELLEGDDLGHIVEKEKEEGGAAPLPASIKLSYIVQVCRALEYAHKRNIVHRDIKPGNIVVTNEGTVKVVDFGIARLTDTSSTSSGMLIGTIDYMSPEQIRGEKVDGRSDIWAVGVMMYEVLAYTKPFQGGNITAVMFAIVSQEPKPIRDLRPDLPSELDDVMRRIFKKEPGERYQNMEELLSELEPVARKMQQESVGVLVSQSEALFNQGDLQRAKEMLKQALVLDTSHLHAKTLLDRVNSAIRQSEVAPKLNAMVAKAEEAFQAGNMEEARRQADAALHMDSNYQPARELLGKLQEAEMQQKIVQTGLREARQRMAEGSLTEADQSLERVLKAVPDNAEAQELRKQIAEEKERRAKRKQLADGVQRARQLWTGQQFDEAMKVLGTLEKEFPGDSEVVKLLEAVKADMAQDEIQRALAEARKLLGAQSFNEALSTLDKLLQRYPNESAAVKLRELVLQERSEHAKQLRLQKELESLKKQVNEEKFADAISTGEALLKEYPDDFELSRLIEFAKAQRAQQDVLKRRQSRHQEINNLVQDTNFDAALAACREALKDFPGDAEFKQRLEQITTQQKEAKTRERQKLLDERLRSMKQAIERGDLTGAIDLGNQTVTVTGKDTDLTKLIEMAKQERSARDLRRKHDEQTLKAIDLLEDKKFDEAAKILRLLERDDILDARVAALMRHAEDKRTPTKEDLALWRSKPVLPAEGEAGELEKTRIGGLGVKPSPGAGPSDVGGATRVIRTTADLEETVRSKGPLVPSGAP